VRSLLLVACDGNGVSVKAGKEQWCLEEVSRQSAASIHALPWHASLARGGTDEDQEQKYCSLGPMQAATKACTRRRGLA
jgi:hypothetical protein